MNPTTTPGERAHSAAVTGGPGVALLRPGPAFDMPTSTHLPAVTARPASRLLLWAAGLLAAVVLSVFLHEAGHGLGARLDGIHVSTGFNQVGNAGRAPGDPDFRSHQPDGFWVGLLGPVTSWALALAFTGWFYRFKVPTLGALAVGTLALVNGLIRAMPMLSFLAAGVAGRLHLEDEVGWSLWYALKYCHPEWAVTDPATLTQVQVARLLSEPLFWAPPLISLAISLACLILTYRKLYLLWGRAEKRWLVGVYSLLPLGVYFAAMPLLNSLDRVVRINW